MLKLILLLIQGLCLVVQLVLRDIPFLALMLTCTLLMGMFFTSIQVICESECLQGVVLLLLFPLAMLLGIYRSCGEVFWPALQ